MRPWRRRLKIRLALPSNTKKGKPMNSRTLILAIFLALTLTACGGGASPELAPGRYNLAMTFQGAQLAGVATIDVAGVGTWNASNPENSYAGDVVSSEDGTVWWFGPADSSALELHTVDGRSTDPAFDATIALTRAP
jgi:hypothetical protein